MAGVWMTCGKICSGKSTYARSLCERKKAVLLSVDEITLALFDQYIGEKHDEYVEKTERYLFDKSVEIVRNGINVVLDWGFWTREEREYAKAFYSERGIACEFRYLSIGDDLWKERIAARNARILAGEERAYYVDDNLARKFGAIFEEPGPEEQIVFIEQK